MDRTMVGLLGVVGALGLSTPGQGAPGVTPDAILKAASYSELLLPIPNAAATLAAVDAQSEAVIDEVQYYYPYANPYYYRHHHHHHHNYYRRRHHHHHHHHHHHGYRRY